MSEQPDLATLSIRDLRQLAGEHEINNRSRLGRDDLIQALTAVISGAATAAAAPLAESAAARAEPLSQAEPEVIDAAAVAHFAEPAPAAAPAPAIAASDDEDDDGADGQEVLDPSAIQGEGEGQPGEGGRRRRRRRRGRGRGRGGQLGPDGQPLPHDDQDHQSQGPSDQRSPNDDIAAGTAMPPQSSPSQPRPPQQQQGQRSQGQPRQQPQQQQGQRQPQQSQRQPQSPSGQQQQGQQNSQRQNQQNQQQNQQGDQANSLPRQPRPRLDGQQRPVPSVLDRLCTFTRGILELCDPHTPTWAQPRLSELLAEAGLSPIPASGFPHADFHEVIGTVEGAPVPPGHIAVIVAPGFALRGDRGDLFPLRKSQVKVAPGGQQPVAPVQLAPQRDEPRFEPRNDSPVVASEAAPASVAPVASEAATGDEPAGFHPPAPAPMAAAGSQPRRDERRRDDRPRDGQRRDDRPRDGQRRDERPREESRSEEPAREAQPEERQHQERSGRYNRTVPQAMAAALPLVMQQAEELAERPKAEGFRSLGLNEQLLADLAGMGYTTPTPIQTEAIPAALAGRDLIGQAQTGTGKTAAFVLPLLQTLYTSEGEGPVALVLSPTRELAKQIHDQFVKIAGASAARAALIYGGVSMDDQFDALDRKPHIVIGTPGRIIDHMKRRTLDLSKLRVAVLDEADQMLDIGFWPDVMWIMSHTPPARQTMLFSATFPDPIRVMAEKHMRDTLHIRIKPAQVTVEQVDQKYIAVAHDKKTALLAHFIETQNPEQLVVFCRTKHQTDRVAEVLKRKNLSAGAIHGDLPQNKRERMLQQFRDRELQCLIATNVAARGLDIPSVSHVVNYDIPENPEEYVHRIGRTARNGAKGIARTFITPEDGQFLVEIEKHIGLLLDEELIEGFTTHSAPVEIKRTIADMPVGTPRLLKPLVGGIRLGRRR